MLGSLKHYSRGCGDSDVRRAVLNGDAYAIAVLNGDAYAIAGELLHAQKRDQNLIVSAKSLGPQ